MRGAPAIAIVGCLSLAVELRKESFGSKRQLRQEIEGKLNYLVSSRPTAVNMKIAADELIALANALAEDEAVAPEDMKVKSVAGPEACAALHGLLAGSWAASRGCWGRTWRITRR